MDRQRGSVRAKIHSLEPHEGGRATGLFTGYRPMVFLWSDRREAHDAVLIIEGSDICPPGEDCVARIEFLRPEAFLQLLTEGAGFDLAEGRRVVARGTITEIL